MNLEKGLINRNSGVSLYQQLKQIILDEIYNCDSEHPVPIPSVEEFCEILDINSFTVYRAISELKKEGYLLETEEGIFIVGTKIKIDLKNISKNLYFENNKSNMTLHKEVIKRKIIKADKNAAEYLGIREDDEVINIMIYHYAKDTIIACSTIFLKYPLCDFVSKKQLSSFCIYDILAENQLTKIKKVQRTLETCYATVIEAKYMNLGRGALINLCSDVGFSNNDEPIIYEIIKYRNEIKYSLGIDLA